MSSYIKSRREAGAVIRASVPKQEIRFPRLFHFEDIATMPRIAFAKGAESGTFISREREGSRYYSQGIGFHAPDHEDVVWHATSWDEAFYCISGKLRIVASDKDGNELDSILEPGDHFWAPAGYKYELKSTGIESLSLFTTAPQMPSGWRYTGDDESYSNLLIALRR